MSPAEASGRPAAAGPDAPDATPSRPVKRRAPRRRSRTRRVLRWLALGAAGVVVVAGVYVGYVGVRRAIPRALPAPTGRYPVGRLTADWTDPARADPLAPRHGVRRELSVWFWYPGARRGPRTAPYAPGAWARLHIPGFPGLGEGSFGALRTHSYAGVPVAAGRFPLAVLEPGLGRSAPEMATIAENLASHGYVVAGVTPTYSANLTVLRGRPVTASTAGNPPGEDSANPALTDRLDTRLVAVWAADARFAATRLTAEARAGRTSPFAGHLDPAHVVYLGHSLGGAASLEACRTDARCAGAADLDGTEYGPVTRLGPRRPVLLLGSANSCVTGLCHPGSAQERAQRATAVRLVAAATAPVWRHEIPGTQHFNFTDFGAYYWAAPLRSLMPLGPADGDRVLRTTNAYVTAFADHVVRGTPAAPLGPRA